MADTETLRTDAPVDAIDPETSSPPKGKHRMDRKTLFVFLGFFLGLIVLVALNMN